MNHKHNSRKYVAKLLLVIDSTTLSLITAEGMCRILFDSINFLVPHIAEDEPLGHRVEPYSARYDAWGHRNKEVPQKADIVAIGDSVYCVASDGIGQILGICCSS